MCPSMCTCSDETLVTSCIRKGLDIVPIQLNPAVEVIILSNNKIAKVEYELAFYINLRHLDFSVNKIQSLGSKRFEMLNKLEFLNVSYNSINILGKNVFKGLTSLRVLDLSHNNIELIEHGSFKDTTDLQNIDLSYNNITSFEDPSIFKAITSLKVLNLHGNQIIDVPSALLKHLPPPCVLQTLTLSENLIEIIEDKSFPAPCSYSLKILSLSDNIINDIEKSAFNLLHNLTKLDLSSNNLTFVPTQQLSKLNHLTELDLSGNRFTIVKPVAFQSLFRLKTLKLSKMPHMNWVDSRAFVDNIRLESVFIEDNPKMIRIPTRIFHGNPHLSYVSLKGNSLVTLDVSHFPLDRLRYLDLSGNPLHCNCSLHWLWTLAQLETKIAMYEPTTASPSIRNLICASPESLKDQLITNIDESTVSCETTWLTVAIITALVLALFGATCVALLLFGSETRKQCWCKRNGRLAAGLHAPSGPPPILMLMPDKHYREAILNSYMKSDPDMKLVEPWLNGETRENEYTVDSAPSNKPHIVYV
ncbi:hypothetical protein O3M35_008775 [Rhynocoris fuscipes]|uniref:LRRCT domain-containing protein n=1 Tax=Rhynocoris fuscipes TaxID=488301 RepID=A0AAW1D8Z5_9HEMI